MPFYTALIAALGAFLFWYVFLRHPSQDGGREPSGAPRGENGAPPPRPVPAQVASPIAMINDPVSATATFLIALAAAKSPLDAEIEARIKQDIVDVMGVTKVDELYEFARNAAEQVTDPSNLMIRFARIWVDLDKEQQQDIYDMASRVAQLHGGADDLQTVTLRQLAGRLGLPGA